MTSLDSDQADRIDWTRAQVSVMRMLRRFGRPCQLRNNRANTYRSARVILTAWRVSPLFGKVYDPLTRRAIWGALDLLDGPPDHESESLQTFQMPITTNPPVIEETLRILDPALPGANLAGVTIYWYAPVRDIKT